MIPTIANPCAEPAWLKGALAGQRACLARAITAVEEGTIDATCVLQAIYPLVGRALVVGFTGAPGVGKSTLIAACIAEARRRGLKVGVLTNHLREVQLEVLRAVQLLPALDALVTVSDAPPKPHPGSYRAACGALGVPPRQAVMVGDSWDNDVAGAVTAGLRAVWYAPAGAEAPEESVPHRRLHSHEPLEHALQVLLG